MMKDFVTFISMLGISNGASHLGRLCVPANPADYRQDSKRNPMERETRAERDQERER